MRSLGLGGMELEEHELKVWARANARSPFLVDDEELMALASEFTEGRSDSEKDGLRIPFVEFPNASKTLGEFICKCERILDSGILKVGHIRRMRNFQPPGGIGESVPELEAGAAIGIALELQEAMSIEMEASPLVKNPAA